MSAEEWRTIPSHDRYQASSLGRIRNARRGNVLKPQQQSNGYMKVHLGVRAQNQLVNRLVCEAFHGPPPTPTAHADHVDFVRSNNRADNLRWLPAGINIGRQLRRIDGGWVCVADEEPPDGYRELTPDQAAALDEQLAAAGW